MAPGRCNQTHIHISVISSPKKEAMIANLKKDLESALRIDEKKLAHQIRTTGFKCRKCAQCCMNEFGDNTVIVSPSQIRKICTISGLERDDFVIPTPSVDRDQDGNIHTFEWVLKKNSNCIFLKEKLCEIYECRPFLCRTYPFFLLDGKLEVCECIGIGGNIGDMESLEMARQLKERYILEIKESMAVFEKFSGFNPGGSGRVCVHDSEGEHWIT
ncbi:MAG: YkgJ family cysteine cluster protein [Candidatus Methanoperedens sp.]